MKNFKLLLLGIGVVTFWRGIWEFETLVVFPSSPLISSITCIFAGIGILFYCKYNNF